MELQETLERYEGSLLDFDQLSEYQQWAFQFFHREEFVANPHLSATLQLDLTAARAVYEQSFQQAEGASFQAYLMWNLVKALNHHQLFCTREIEQTWYLFKNLPVYFPVAVGGEERFKDVVIDDVGKMDWSTFVPVYRHAIENPSIVVGQLPPLTWAISHFIGNLPYLNFTAFQIHRAAVPMGRPLFYFGQRQQVAQRLTIPLSIMFDHANSDPYVLNQLMQTYQEQLTAV